MDRVMSGLRRENSQKWEKTDRQTDRLAERQTGRQTDGQRTDR